MKFMNKVVLITGGGTGIGKAAAHAFLAEGAKVVLNGRREAVLSKTAFELDPSNANVAIVVGDIRHRSTSQQMVEVAIRRFGGVDILINNAGIFKPTPFLDHTEAEVDDYIDIMLKGAFFSAQAAIPELQKRGGGAIVNVGSMWASQAIGITPSAAYSAAKAGIHALTHNLAIEFAKDKIRVNTVAPAIVETPVYGTFLPPEQVGPLLTSLNSFHPLGRYGQPQDIVNSILFLAGDQASWITGVILPLDGGVMAGRNAS